MSEVMETDDAEEDLDSAPILFNPGNAEGTNQDIPNDHLSANHTESNLELHEDNSNQETISVTSSQQSVASIAIVIEDSDTSTSPIKRKRLSDDEDEAQTCPICLDTWTTSGEHRLCALKCGHLFGASCVKRWLNSETKKSCPTCKKRVHGTDIRYIYGRKIVVMDNTELTVANQKLEKVTEEKNKAQMELVKATYRIHTLKDELEQCKRKIEILSRSKQGTVTRQEMRTSTVEVLLFDKEKTLNLGTNSNCRVLDSNVSLNMIGVSLKSTNPLYPGFGIKLLDVVNFKPIAFAPLHSETIRDVKFHDSKLLLLSCSMDKKAKILDTNVNQMTTTTLDGRSPLWSCCWDTNSPHVYLGQQQGSVLKYDIRNPSEPISTISVEGDYSPVVSVQAFKPSSTFPSGGAIFCKLNSMWLYENTTDTKHMLSMDGPFISMTYNQDNDHLLSSSRPSSRCPYSRHTLCGLVRQDDTVMCNVVHTFNGGTAQKMLSKTCFLSRRTDYVAAYVEDKQNVTLWSVNNGDKVGCAPAREPVLDLNGVRTSRGDFLLTLTESNLSCFKII